MLKALCLDDVKHKHLIEFIEQYEDNSMDSVASAIRLLMQKGYEAINSNNDFSNIKKEIVNDVLTIIKNEINPLLKRKENDQINNQLLENNSQLLKALTDIATRTPNYVPIPSFSSPMPEKISSLSVPPSSSNSQVSAQALSQKSTIGPIATLEKKAVERKLGNSLLSNILSNAKR